MDGLEKDILEIYQCVESFIVSYLGTDTWSSSLLSSSSVKPNSLWVGTVACQTPLSSTVSWSLLKFTSVELVMLFQPVFFHIIIVSQNNRALFLVKNREVVVVNPPANAGDTRDVGLIPGSGRSPGTGNDNPLQYSCLENSMDRGTWWAIVCGDTKSWILLRNWACTHPK